MILGFNVNQIMFSLLLLLATIFGSIIDYKLFNKSDIVDLQDFEGSQFQYTGKIFSFEYFVFCRAIILLGFIISTIEVNALLGIAVLVLLTILYVSHQSMWFTIGFRWMYDDKFLKCIDENVR